MDLPNKVVELLEKEQGRFIISYFRKEWLLALEWGKEEEDSLLALEWGKEEEDSDMIGAAAYAVDSSLEKAIQRLIKEAHLDS